MIALMSADDHPGFGRKTHAHMPEGLRKAGWEGTWFDTYSGRAASYVGQASGVAVLDEKMLLVVPPRGQKV